MLCLGKWLSYLKLEEGNEDFVALGFRFSRIFFRCPVVLPSLIRADVDPNGRAVEYIDHNQLLDHSSARESNCCVVIGLMNPGGPISLLQSSAAFNRSVVSTICGLAPRLR